MAQENQGSTSERFPEPATEWSPVELEILRVLAGSPASSLRRGQIHSALALDVKPSPARVGQILSKLQDRGLLEHRLAGARGNRNTAFYSLSVSGRRLAAEVAASPIRSATSAPAGEVAERVSVYDAAYRQSLAGFPGPRDGREVKKDSGIEEIFGILEARSPVSLEAMDEALRRRAVSRYAR